MASATRARQEIERSIQRRCEQRWRRMDDARLSHRRTETTKGTGGLKTGGSPHTMSRCMYESLFTHFIPGRVQCLDGSVCCVWLS